MIDKIPGVPRFDYLLVIHLYKSDYNLLLKLLWACNLVLHEANNNGLHNGQAGSSPGHQCIDVFTQKEMKYLYYQLTRTPMAMIDIDRKSC
jgi:hypothetical protein